MSETRPKSAIELLEEIGDCLSLIDEYSIKESQAAALGRAQRLLPEVIELLRDDGK